MPCPGTSAGCASSSGWQRSAAALLFAALGTLSRAQGLPTPPQVSLPQAGLQAHELALVINLSDPDSVALGRYYAQQRGIGADRVFGIRLPTNEAEISAAQFVPVLAALRARLPAEVQAFALAWTLPYRVACMSITSAFAFGFDPDYCAQGCLPTRPSPYFDSRSQRPFADHRLRPAMLLAGRTLDEARAMIDRGVRSDHRWPAGKAYLLSTSDRKRNVRAKTYDQVRARLRVAYPIERVDADQIDGRDDVMFYFTGVQKVGALERNRYLDGAMADHLTSFGGELSGSAQTTALEWLAAGVTGSYGTTVEPCSFREKFPDVGVAMSHYLVGQTLIEAYWKSVRMPGQGVFVGEPLARPFGGLRLQADARGWVLRTRQLAPGRYLLQSASSAVGPFRNVAALTVRRPGVHEMRLPPAPATFHRLVAQPNGSVPLSY
jgi:uncharacterized protein (TIGR03790 family)